MDNTNCHINKFTQIRDELLIGLRINVSVSGEHTKGDAVQDIALGIETADYANQDEENLKIYILQVSTTTNKSC